MRLAIVFALSVVAVAALAYSQDQPRPASDRADLLQARLKAAEKEHAAVSSLVLQGLGSADGLVEASERMLAAKLSLAESAPEKLEAYDEMIQLAQRLQDQLAPYVPTSRPVQEAARVEYWLLDLKIRRLELQHGQHEPPRKRG